jgi:hypothetical protein
VVTDIGHKPIALAIKQQHYQQFISFKDNILLTGNFYLMNDKMPITTRPEIDPVKTYVADWLVIPSSSPSLKRTARKPNIKTSIQPV